MNTAVGELFSSAVVQNNGNIEIFMLYEVYSPSSVKLMTYKLHGIFTRLLLL